MYDELLEKEVEVEDIEDIDGKRKKNQNLSQEEKEKIRNQLEKNILSKSKNFKKKNSIFKISSIYFQHSLFFLLYHIFLSLLQQHSFFFHNQNYLK